MSMADTTSPKSTNREPGSGSTRTSVAARKRRVTPAVVALVLLVVLAGAGFYVWQRINAGQLPATIASSNGRIEATEVDVAAKLPGRIKTVLVNEGDFVTAGQVLAQMDTDTLEAQKREYQAQLQRAITSVQTYQSLVKQREAEREAAVAVVAQREADLDGAQRRYQRTSGLVPRGAEAVQALDDDRAKLHAAEAAISTARAQVAATEAAISSAKSQVIDANAAIDAARASVERVQADINDSTLRAPRDGRIQYKIAEAGEVMQPGGRVVNFVDLSDVYMTFYLPEQQAGRVAMGADAHIALDALPDVLIPAKISYVADVAQFTPKTVETAQERQKLMFRVKAQIPEELLRKYIRDVKTGIPGMAYVKLDGNAEWPEKLKGPLVQ